MGVGGRGQRIGALEVQFNPYEGSVWPFRVNFAHRKDEVFMFECVTSGQPTCTNKKRAEHELCDFNRNILTGCSVKIR